ncbi:hypothetical protein M0D21_06560 [Aquimarina sp. D1M17]|uniref:hypothetical protein n=1 Tax=Aquimarina acroporae TaxID=2937283 RepID=UPI0020BF92CC|nr:hypothetical protein [Aquimarina acroporae]MCK8521219.1 hypothetical protein [Aquimarina acroporae]
MNLKELTYLLQHPDQLKTSQLNTLEKVSKEFPYFQAIRPLLLKALKNQGSFRYNQELKTTAAYTTDRAVLFDFITSDHFQSEKQEQETLKKTKSDIEVVDHEEVKTLPRMAMDDAVTMKIKEAEDVLDPGLFSIRKKESLPQQIHQKKEDKQLPNSDENLQINQPLDFTKKETHSFAEWLKLTSLKPVERDLDQQETNTIDADKKESDGKLKQEEKFNLIDEFIANNPKIQPASKNTPTRNLAKENQTPADELMTETLAKVYLAQKNYKKAIQAYNILILKNPEKSGFFADQIRAIKKLQENK